MLHPDPSVQQSPQDIPKKSARVKNAEKGGFIIFFLSMYCKKYDNSDISMH